MRAIQRRIKEDLNKLQSLKDIYSSREGWVVESQNHINVGEGNGLNGTAFAVKSPMSCGCASVWNTKEEAEKKGANYHLEDGKGRPVYMRFTKAEDFFEREIESAKQLLIFLPKK